MIPAHVVEIVTPRGILLHGLWLGPKRAKRAIIWVHGLASSLFSKIEIARRLADGNTAVLLFNNRGHDIINKISRKRGNKRKKLGGGAHEIFSESIDDIQGAITFSRRQGAYSIFLAGHSTGAQKSMYWAHKKRGKGVQGIILLAPMSDYSVVTNVLKLKTKRAHKYAEYLVRHGRKHELLPPSVWPFLSDAQRFLSLYSGRGPEEIFTYWNPLRRPRIVRSVKKPILVLLAGADEYADRPAEKIATWFRENVQEGNIVIMTRATHSFRGNERSVARKIREFIASL